MSLPPRRPTSSELSVTSLEFRIPADYDDTTQPVVQFNPTALVRVLVDAKPDGNGGLRFTATAEPPEDISMHLNRKGYVESEVLKRYVKYENPPVTPLFLAKTLNAAAEDLFEALLHETDPEPDPNAIILGQIENPLNIDLPDPQQGFLMIELNPKLNWCFSRNSYGITTKDFYLDDNFGIRFLGNDKVFTKEGSKAPMEHSRLAYFAFARRDADTPQKFNFHVEYIWSENGKGYRIPMIFDPDIPSSGGGSIP